MNLIKSLLLIFISSIVTSINAAELYADQISFLSSLGTSITDDYENPGYQSIQYVKSDAEMSTVLNETTYHSTGHPNINIVAQEGLPIDANPTKSYCAGCNGSFLLNFETTSLSQSNSIFGVGFNYWSFAGGYAYITFADNTTLNISIESSYSNQPWSYMGITSGVGIRNIAFGLINGGVNTFVSMGIDNLTIGSPVVPVPSAALLFGSGLLGLIGSTRRRSKRI